MFVDSEIYHVVMRGKLYLNWDHSDWLLTSLIILLFILCLFTPLRYFSGSDIIQVKECLNNSHHHQKNKLIFPTCLMMMMMIKAWYDDDDDDDDDDMRVRVRETGGLQAGRCCPAPVRTINHQTSDRSQLAAGRRLLISVSCLSWVPSHHTQQTRHEFEK